MIKNFFLVLFIYALVDEKILIVYTCLFLSFYIYINIGKINKTCKIKKFITHSKYIINFFFLCNVCPH